MPNFASRFNLALETKGISRRELARLSGVHVNTLNNWAGGNVPNPHPKLLNKVAPVLSVAYEWLRLGEGPMAPRHTPRPQTLQGVSERIGPGSAYEFGEETAFDAELMAQVVRLVEDHNQLFRRRLQEAQLLELMERSYQTCLEAGLTGQHAISMSQFQELLKRN
jgi:transcriptional regulator with XRE-family HTH domain